VKILRTIIWVLAALGFLVFAIYNWQPVELRLWQNLVLETKVPVLALLAFAAGFVPMWALHRSMMWNMNRRVRTLENSLKNSAMAQRADGITAASGLHVADSPVDKSGKSGREGSEPFDFSDTGGDGGGSAGE
jgi:lipopolysaccharide assembly protein A